MIGKVWNRVYGDFLMPSRLHIYSDLLKTARLNGYIVCPVLEYWRLVGSGNVDPKSNYLILRHDVDTDLATAKEMWKIERSLDVSSSYYFRLSTLDYEFMREIEAAGGEASYHYEEIASVAKQQNLGTRDEVLQSMPQIKKLFSQNLADVRRRSGLPMKSVASHGDFINRRLKMKNSCILTDRALREEMGIELEVYDDTFFEYIENRYSDGVYPHQWKPSDPMDGLRRKASTVYVLIHPRNWRSNIKENLHDDVLRVAEGVRYLVGRFR